MSEPRVVCRVKEPGYRTRRERSFRLRRTREEATIREHFALVCAGLLLASCENAPQDRRISETVHVDSAGVPVVLHPPPEVAPPPTWSLAPEPVEVGQVRNGPPVVFSDVKDGTVLDDGTMVVVNATTSELRFFDADGFHLRSVGREGQGPGEFLIPRFLGRFGGDSLLVVDVRIGRISILDSEGRFSRPFRFPAELTNARPMGVLSDGRLVVTSSAEPSGSGNSWTETGVTRSPLAVHVLGPTGDIERTMGPFPGTESYQDAERRAAALLLFGRGLAVRASGDLIAIGNTDSYRIRIHDSQGELICVVAQDRPFLPVERSHMRLGFEELMGDEDNVEIRKLFASVVEDMPRPETHPAYRDIEIDSEGLVWVEEARAPGRERATWQVFDPAGELVARAVFPAQFEVLDITSSTVLGVYVDDYGVEWVQSYALDRSPSSP